MSSLRSAILSLGILMSSAVSLPVWAAPQSQDNVTSASNLGEAVAVSNTPLKAKSDSSSNLIDKVNAQLGSEIARQSPFPQQEPSFRWQGRAAR